MRNSNTVIIKSYWEIKNETEKYVQLAQNLKYVFLRNIIMNIDSQKILEMIHAKLQFNFLLQDGIVVFMDIQKDFFLSCFNLFTHF